MADAGEMRDGWGTYRDEMEAANRTLREVAGSLENTQRGLADLLAGARGEGPTIVFTVEGSIERILQAAGALAAAIETGDEYIGGL